VRPLQLVALVVYAFGAFAYATLAWCWFKDTLARRKLQTGPEPMRGEDVFTGSMGIVAALWFVLCLVMTLLRGQPGIRMWPLYLASMITASVFPPLIALGAWLEARDRATRVGAVPRPSWKRAMVGFWVACPLYVAGSLVAIFVPEKPSSETILWMNVAFGGLIAAAGIYAAIVEGAYPAGPARHKSGRPVRFLYLGMSGLFGLLLLAGFGVVRIGDVVELLMRTTPLLFLIAGAWLDSRFKFYDIVVKRAVTMLLAIVIAAAGAVVLLPVVRTIEPAWAGAVVFAVALSPFLVLFPGWNARVQRVLEKAWLGRSFSREEAIRQVLRAVQQVSDENGLREAAERVLGEMHRCAVQVVLPGSSAAEPDFRVVQEVPFSDRAGRKGAIRVGSREGLSTWLSEDLEILGAIGEVILYMQEHLALQGKRRELELETGRAQLRALRAQVNPHFLFNALNAIAGWIHKDPKHADRMVERLADVFRYVLRGSEHEFATLAEEMEFVSACLDIEQSRFGARLTASVAWEPGTAQVRIPSLVVHTLVENAVKHGVARTRGPARLEVVARFEAPTLVVEVADDGPGLATPSEADGEGFGLRSVRERLAGHYGDAASLALVREGGRTIARLRIPA
jgi:hypothetical protein